MDENKWKGHIAKEVPDTAACDGCAFDTFPVRQCPANSGGPSCMNGIRDDGRTIIWVPSGGTSELVWHKVTEKLPPEEELVLVLVRNKNKEDGIPLFDVATHDGDAWRPRQNTWEDIVMWAAITAPEGFK